MRIRNIWQEYGLSGNPYHTDHLQATSEDAHFYVRREPEEEELGTFLAREDHGAIFVEGHVGVGKTTFVNQTQHLVRQQNDVPVLLPTANVVEIQIATTPEHLVLSILSAVLKSLHQYEPKAAKDPAYVALEAYTKQARLTSWAVGGAIAGTGGSVARSHAATEPPALTLQAMHGLLDDLTRLVTAHGFARIVVLLNNLDNVEQRLAFSLLGDLRDTLLGRGGWLFVLAGPVGIRATLASDAAHRRLSERITANPVILRPLSKSGVHQVIQKRIAALRLGPGAQPPVPAKVIDLLYQASGGEIRYVLNRADGITRLVARDLPVAGPIEEAVALAALQKQVRDHVENLGLTKRQAEVLAAIARAGRAQPKQHDAFGLKSSQAFVSYLRDFYARGLLEKEETGRETIYTPRGDIVLHHAGIPS